MADKPEVKESQSQPSAKSPKKQEGPPPPKSPKQQKAPPSPKSAQKQQESPLPKSSKKSIRQLIIESGFHWDVDRRPTPKGPRGEQNEELMKFKEKVEQAHLKDSKSKQAFWNLHKRRQLREVSVRVFSAGFLASVVLAIITFLWYYHFTHIYNLYMVPVAVAPKNNSSSASEEPVHIETPFISGVKYADWAFEQFAYGLLFLTVGSICADYARRRPYKYRVWWYLIAIILVVGAIIYFVTAPMLPLFASNDDEETAMLKRVDGEYEAYRNDVKGSLEFFQNGQCENNEESANGKDEDTKIRMNFFCEMISRLTYFFYFMWVSILVPLLILVLCLLEVFANAKSWHMKAEYHYKKRTTQQIEADKSRSMQAVVQINTELLY